MAGKLTRKQAIKEFCLGCSGGVRAEVRNCVTTACPLWPFRMGSEQKDACKDKEAPEERA